MIESITLTNFQRHGKFHLELDPNVTTLTGSSDKGKSAVLRAFRWVFLNVPSGDAFVRHGSNRCTVTARFDGHTVARRRGGSTNAYRLDGRILKAFGAAVPAPVAELLNVGPVNFQGQLESPFWFLLPAPEVSRQLNEIINLGLIDRVLAAAAAGNRRINSDVTLTTERLSVAKARKAALAWVVPAGEALAALEGAESAARSAQQRAESVAVALLEAQRWDSTRRRIQDALAPGLIAIRAGHEYFELVDKIGSLESLVEEWEVAETVTATPAPDLAPLSALMARHRVATARLAELDSLLADYARHAYHEEQAGHFLHAAEEEIENTFGGVCPTCQSPLPSWSATSTCPTGFRPLARKPKVSGTPRRPST